MTDAIDPVVTEGGGGAAPERVDLVLQVLMWVLVVSVIAMGAGFGWTVYQTRYVAKYSTPAMRALLVLEGLAKKSPNSAPMRVRLAEAQAAAGLYDDAIGNLQIAVKIDKSHTGAWLDLGILAMLKNKPTVAQGYFQKVIDLTSGQEYQDIDQRREQSLFYMGELALQQKHWEDALKYLNGAIRIRSDASDTYLALAEAYKGLGQYDPAIENAQMALNFDPNFPDGHFLLGQVYQSAGQDASAAVEYRRTLQIEGDKAAPAHQDALEALGPASARLDQAQSALKQSNKQQALQFATIAYAVDPTSVDAVKLYAQLLEQT